MSHALLSPSASKRWIECPKSARLTEFLPETISSYAADGTIAHSVAESKLNHRLGYSGSPPKCEDVEMDEYTDDYANFVLEQAATLTNPTVYVEQRVDCSKYIPECFGTCDALIVSDGVLHIIDLKSGSGIKVDAEGNDQLRIYSLGALAMFGFLYDIATVRMSIFQPKLGNCSTWEIPVDELTGWAENTLIPAARLAWNGEGDYKAGTHCQFCKAKAECRKRAEANLALAVYDFTDPALLQICEIADILGKIDGLMSWASDVKEYALSKALAGTRFDGWKVVEGRSTRHYSDEASVAKAVTDIGLDPYEHKLLGITAMTSLLGKKRFEETLGVLTYKPQGKPVLVPVTDKRKEINTAADDFADPIENLED
ncbi:DUF2800 domain-containing protein [Pygmaiobacter massiliensis]|uniref:DUF2800 domain-containing protein n=1 Tax=Pygmaiobacter massiliensis TaxID=1917873 RepID=UPI002A7FCE6B|nr:DUF2800 domain-containing protein [Pygmaiobacter massiliensis]MDY4784695.1 DUF2800 domain-containing protein [Pygmaiobacter massiliensis]